MLRCLFLGCFPIVLAAADTYFPPPDAEGGWREAKSELEMRDKAGMDLRKLEPAYPVTEKTTANGGLVVVRKGWLVFEKYFGKASRNANPDMASTGKGFCSIACGIMLDDVAAAHKATPAQVALAWLIARPGITAPIVSATSVAQLKDVLAAAQLNLSEREVGQLDAASAE